MAYTFAGRWGPFDLGHLVNVDSTPNVLAAQPAQLVTVYLRGTTTKAVLYSDRTKVATVPNPFSADSYGNGTFLADPGEYDLAANGLTLAVTVVPDPEELSTADAAVTAGIGKHTRSLNLLDYGAVADGATDIGPALRAALADCVALGIREIHVPGNGGNSGAQYYVLSSAVTIPLMPVVHPGAPTASLKLRGDGYGNTLIAGTTPLDSLSPLVVEGIEFETNVNLRAAGSYPSYFYDVEFNEATIVAWVPSSVYLINCRMQYDGGWCLYSQAGANAHHSIWLTGCEISTAFVVGGSTATIVDQLGIAGGTAGTVYAFSALGDSNTMVVNASVAANTGIVDTEATRAIAAEATKLAKAANLSDLASAPTARTNLGLGNAATRDVDSASGVVGLDGAQNAHVAGNLAVGADGGTFHAISLTGKAALQEGLSDHSEIQLANGWATLALLPPNTAHDGAPIDFGGGVGVSRWPEVTTAPTSSPSSGGISYTQGGRPRWRAADGTIYDLSHTPGVYLGTTANQAAMLALSSARIGDWTVRSDLNAAFVLTAANPATLGSWTQIPGGGGGGGSAAVPWRSAAEFAATPAQAAAFGVTGEPISNFYSTLAAAQVDYPTAQALSDFLDTVILEKATAGSITSGDPATTRRRGINQLFVPAGSYQLNRSLSLISTEWFVLFGEGILKTNFQCHSLSGYAFELNGVSYSRFSDFAIYAGGGTSAGAIHLHWVNTASLNSTTFVKFSDILVASQGGDFGNGFVVGDDNTLQNDSIVFEHCALSGLWSPGNTTTWQKAISLGPGAGGNTLDIRVHDCSIASWNYGVAGGGANYHVTGFQHANNGVDFTTNTPGGEYRIDGGRSEGAQRLLWCGTSGITGGGSLAIRDVQFNANGLHADGQWIIVNYSGFVASNLTCSPDPRVNTLHGLGVKVAIAINQGAGGTFALDQIAVPESLDDGLVWNSSAHGTVRSWGQYGSDGNFLHFWAFRAYGGEADPTHNVAAEFRSAGNGLSGYPVTDWTLPDATRVARLTDDQGFYLGPAIAGADSGLRRLSSGILVSQSFNGILKNHVVGHVFNVSHSAAGSLTIDANNGDHVVIALSADCTGLTINNLRSGQHFTISWRQDGTGNRAYAWPVGTQWNGSGAPPLQHLNPAQSDTVHFYWDGFELIEISRPAILGAADPDAVETTPGSVTGLVGWWRANTFSLADGSAVANWPDDSGNNHPAIQATPAAKPAYRAAILNGFPVVRFDRAASQLLATAAPVTTSVDTFTMLVVARVASISVPQAAIYNGTGTSGYGLAPSSGNTVGKVAGLIGGIAWVEGSASTPTDHRIYAFRRNNPTTQVYMSGGAPVATASIGSVNVPTTKTQLGSDGSRFFGGDIAEAMIYSTALSDADLNTVAGYLASKYALAWTPL